MLRIAHTADIHWRGLSRHDEYRQVFLNFIEDCKKNKVDHIFVGGDIFHTKTTGISPEYIEQLTWWLESLSKVCEVHLTLGNHDGNLVNLSRQDAVSPVVQALNNPKIHLYKKSGVYEFHKGYTFCVYSLFDEENWSNVKPVEGKINIACYHGPVQGSKTEVGWELDGIKVSFFKDYDFALLGDIHQYQHLDYREDSNGKKKPWISYPGPPVQQGYAEDVQHGYLLWELRSQRDWDVTFRKLPNPKPYVTIQWNGSVSDLISTASNYPDGSRFRVRSAEALGQKEFSNISESLKNVKSATEVTFKSDFFVDKSVVRTGSSVYEKTDLRNHEVLLKMMKDYYSTVSISDDQWKLVNEQIKTYLSSVTVGEETTRNSKWSLRYLEFENMFAYGPDNVINFDKLNGIVGIFGPNRIGKSSIVGTIMYALFNATDRGVIKNVHVCNVRKPYCSSKAVLNHNGTDYVIERQTTKSENKKGVVSATTSLNVFRVKDDGDADDLAGEQRNDTEKVIRGLIGNQEDFMMTSLSAQGETNQFISQGSTKRRAVLSRFLDLDIFDKLFELSNKELASLKSQLKNYPDRDWVLSIKQYEDSIEEYEKEIKKLHDELKRKQALLSELQVSLSNHKDVTPVTTDQVESFSKHVKILQQTHDTLEDQYEKLNLEIKESNKKLKTIESVKSENNIEELKKKVSSLKKLEKAISDLSHIYEKENTLLLQQQKSLKILDEVPCGDEFPTCKFIKDAHVNKSKIENQVSLVSTSLQNLNEAKESLSALESENFSEKLEKLEKLLSLESKLTLDISRKETECAKFRSTLDSKVLELQTAKNKLLSLELALKNEENEEAVSIKSNIEKLSKDIDALMSAKVESATRKGKVSATLDKVIEEKEAREKLLEKMKVYELVNTAFSKKGLPLIIIRSQLPAINVEISKILQGIVDFTVELENDESSDSLEIYINYGDSRRIIELCSGMEKTVASLAIRVAMINVSTLPKSDIFIMDEGFGTLDDASVESCNRLLVSLKRYFKTILIITHVDGIKDVVDHIVEITKNEKNSKVVFDGDS